MKVIRVIVTSAEVQWTDISTVGDIAHWDQVVTGLRLSGLGFLADKSEVRLDIRPTLDEQARLLDVFNEVAARLAAEDDASP